MSDALDPAVIRAAMRLADGCARSDIEILGLEVARGEYAVSESEEGRRARRLDTADARMREAVAYLTLRRLAIVRIDADGPVVVLLLDRFNEAEQGEGSGADVCPP